MLGYFSQKLIEDEELGLTPDPCPSEFEEDCEYCDSPRLYNFKCNYSSVNHCSKCCENIHS
tara:strand:+ start:58 stop:240 length:183 start_codon:yes stop_codon:yes gene_type:complete